MGTAEGEGVRTDPKPPNAVWLYHKMTQGVLEAVDEHTWSDFED